MLYQPLLACRGVVYACCVLLFSSTFSAVRPDCTIGSWYRLVGSPVLVLCVCGVSPRRKWDETMLPRCPVALLSPRLTKYMAATCCVENCRYAVWGGATNCTVVEQQDNEISDKYGCWCDPGLVETDSLGNPSCVRKRSLIGLYVVVGAVAGLAVAFVLLKARAHCLLPRAAQATRRARLRVRLIMATSLYGGSSSLLFFFAAARIRSSTPCGISLLQALYTVSMPVVIYGGATTIEIWVDALPKQLIDAQGYAARLRYMSETRGIFKWLGLVGMVACASFGIMTFLFLENFLVFVRVTNLVASVIKIFSIFLINLVAVNLTSIISRAKLHASTSARFFYNGALRVLWAEVLTLSLSAVVWTASAVVMEFTQDGRDTPVYPVPAMTIDATVGSCTAIHFARIHATRHSSFQSLPQQQQQALRLALAPGGTGVTHTMLLGGTGNVISASSGGRRTTTTGGVPSIPEEELGEWDGIGRFEAYGRMSMEEGSHSSEDSIRKVRTVSRALEYAVNPHIQVLPTSSDAYLESDDDAAMVPADAKPIGNSPWSLAPSARVVPALSDGEDQEKPVPSSPRTTKFVRGFIRGDGLFFNNEKMALSTVDEGC